MKDCWSLSGSCVFLTLIWVSQWSKAGSTALSSCHPVDSSECHWSQFCHFLVTLCVLVMLRRHLKPKGGPYWTAQVLGSGAWCYQCRWAGGFVWGSCTKPSPGAWGVVWTQWINLIHFSSSWRVLHRHWYLMKEAFPLRLHWHVICCLLSHKSPCEALSKYPWVESAGHFCGISCQLNNNSLKI